MSTESLGTGAKLSEISWWPIVVGKEDPEKFAEQINSKCGWISDQNPSYRFDIVLALRQSTNVHKIRIDAINECIPSKIEFRIGIDNRQIDEPNYESSKNAHYHSCGIVHFYQKRGNNETFQSQNLYIDMDCRYVWMTISEPFSHQNNPYNQVGLKNIIVYGYPLQAVRNGENFFTNSGTAGQARISAPTSRSSSLASGRHNRLDEQSSAMNSSNGGGSVRNLNPASDCGERDSPVTHYEVASPNRSSSVIESDGFVSMGDRLGEEPLACVRTVRKILANKHQKALKVDRQVEAAMCLRAIQRLDEADAKIVRLKSLMRDRLSIGEIEKAKHYQLAINDIRDTVFRVAQIDLLLKRDDLRAIGVISKWANE